MKNKVFYCAALSLLCACFISCNNQEDVDVNKVASELGTTAFDKTLTRSLTRVNGLTMNVVEWNITDAEKHQIVPSYITFGDGLYDETTGDTYTYTQGDLRPDGLGFSYTFTTASGVSQEVLYWGNSIIIEDDTIGDTAAPIANVRKIAADLPNHKWEYLEEPLSIRYDTTTVMDTTITSVKRPDPNTGKPVIVKDTTIAEKTVITADTLGLASYLYMSYDIRRDEKTLANTITYKKIERAYKVNAEGTATVQDGADKVEENTYHWGLSSITSSKRFVVSIQATDGTKSELRMSGFDISKKVLTIGNYEYKAAE